MAKFIAALVGDRGVGKATGKATATFHAVAAALVGSAKVDAGRVG